MFSEPLPGEVVEGEHSRLHVQLQRPGLLQQPIHLRGSLFSSVLHPVREMLQPLQDLQCEKRKAHHMLLRAGRRHRGGVSSSTLEPEQDLST